MNAPNLWVIDRPLGRTYTIKDGTLIDGPGWLWANLEAGNWIRNEATVQKNEAWQKALAEQMGPDWKNEYIVYSNVRGMEWMGMLIAVSDGKMVTEPKPVNAKDGSLIFTALAGSWVHYLDAKGIMQAVYRPIEIELPSGEVLMTSNKDIHDDKLMIINICDGGGEDVAGEIVWTAVTRDSDARISNSSIDLLNKDLSYARYFEVEQKYIANYSEEIVSFLQTGDASIEIILPTGLPCSDNQTVQLP